MKYPGKIILLIIVFFVATFPSFTQMPAAITIEPANATVYDEITLTFDPEEACFMAGSLSGLPYVAMHSGVNVDGNLWQYVIEFNGTGANGQSPVLTLNADDSYSITFTPYDFYGFNPGANVIEICAVFNNGNTWDNDGRDFVTGGSDCMDFFIPIDPGTPPVEPFLHSIDPNSCDQGASVNVQIFGLNTNFQAATTSAWLKNGNQEIGFNSVYAVNDTALSAQIFIPGEALPGYWNLHVENEIDDTLLLIDAFLINDTSVIIPPMPPAITIMPENATAYDNITLTFDTKLSCPDGALLDAGSVNLHAGVTINGFLWQYVILFDTSGVNGQSTNLSSNGDSTWSMTFMPAAYFGIPPGTNVEAINCVFNGGDWSLGEGKDFDENYECIDFYIPLSLYTGVARKDKKIVIVYPNPATNRVFIKSDHLLKSYSIYSNNGILVKSGIIQGGESTAINIEKLSPGLYFLETITDKGIINRQKLIKVSP